jgi:hypothetical protein
VGAVGEAEMEKLETKEMQERYAGGGSRRVDELEMRMKEVRVKGLLDKVEDSGEERGLRRM